MKTSSPKEQNEEKPLPMPPIQVAVPVFGSLKEFSWNMLLIIVGSCISALAINGILLPQKFLSGGLTGIVLGIKFLFPAASVSVLYFVLNIPIFMLGSKMVGRRFFWYSVIGVVVLSAALYFIKIELPVQDKILAAILAGIIVGVGAGIVLRSRGSGGGLDVLSVILLNKFSLRIGNTFLGVNIVILSVAAILVSLDAALYTLIYMYVSSQMIEIILTGLSQRKVVLVISQNWKEISDQILHRINRGVTLLHGQGGYSGKEEKILYTVITMRELPRVKDLIRSIDPNAFVVIYNTMEVMGQRIGNQPHW
ncbi:MAG: YitT family protein [Thermodesulfobacteriota bacterium]